MGQYIVLYMYVNCLACTSTGYERKIIVCLCVILYVCVCACVRACVRVRACARGCVVWVGGCWCFCVWCVRMCRRVLCITLALFSLSVQPRSSPSFRVYWTHLSTMASRPTDPYAGEHCKKIGLTVSSGNHKSTNGEDC